MMNTEPDKYENFMARHFGSAGELWLDFRVKKNNLIYNGTGYIGDRDSKS